ncbi:MAG: TetR family transcriptional regulator [Woeseiaceae bacterium]
MSPKQTRKAETRQLLLTVTADALATGRSFDTMSLREIAKLAGIAPTSFYRHFHHMEDLGLALIEEQGKALFAVIEDVRGHVTLGQSLIRSWVGAVYDFILANQGLSRMIVQESLSPESPFRAASESLFLALSSDLADYLEQEAKQREVPLAYPRLAANAMVSIMFTTGIALLNAPEGDRDRHVDAAVIKVKMILRGAESLSAG